MSSSDADRWRRVETICDAALRLEPAERAAYLDTACRGDESLRAEVEALLARDASAERFLEAPVGAVAADVMKDSVRDLIGRRLGDYDITARLGEGGMGEVYRARDRKLGRDVAIKVLPDAFAGDPERLKRFEREARLLATVNHSGIGAIYGLVEADGVRALVLELVDGKTLGETLARGPLPLPRALVIAAQISDAFDHAHRRGITHRDLKPSNVMLTAAGGVKLLDFGVGKWAPTPGVDAATRPSTLTGEGAIVGTLHYMAPEQLEGKDTDARSDIFGFGAVIYEMLTGRKAFDGPSQASIIAAVMEAPAPRVTGIGGAHAPQLERIVNKCLAKNPDERWQSARDLGDELRWLADDVTRPSTGSAERAAPTRPQSRWLPLAASGLAVLALGLVSWDVFERMRAAPSPMPLVQFEIHPPQGAPYTGRGFDISHDGTQLAYSNSTPSTMKGGGRGLHVRRLDRLDSYLIPDTDGGGMPRFSPDGQWIAYWSRSSLRKVRANGEGPSQVVGENIGGIHGLSWQLPGEILIASADRGFRRIRANGGSASEFTTPKRETEVDHHSPSPLPDGRHMLVAVHGENNRFSIAWQSIDGNDRTVIVESGFEPVYSPTGHLVFGRGSSIFAAPFDITNRQLTGPEVALVERVDVDPPSGDMAFRLSASGVLVYVPQQPRTGRTLTWVGRDGRLAPIAEVQPASFEMPRLSPDGAQLAYVVEEADSQRQIWTYEFASRRRVQRTQDGDHWAPLWTRDSKAVIYGRATAAGSDIILQPLDGSDVVRLGGNTNRLFPGALSLDGQTLLLSEAPPTDEYFLSQLTVGQPGAPTKLQVAGRHPRGVALSPTGRWMAFSAIAGQIRQIFIQAYPLSGQPQQVSADGGRDPVWSRDGGTLFYRSGDRLLAIPIDTSRGLTWQASRQIFEADVVSSFLDYDVANDGRFVMIAEDPREREEPHFNVVVNWASELAARVPVRRD